MYRRHKRQHAGISPVAQPKRTDSITLGTGVIVLLLVLLWHTANSASLNGLVVRIADGDTLTLLTDDHKQHRIRLAEIDTPEKHQPYGKRAKQALAAKVFRKRVTVRTEKKDRYGRWIGHVFLGDRDINAEMVAEGHAWVYRRYSKNPALLRLERKAREEKRGLWALPESQRIPPWQWRRERKH